MDGNPKLDNMAAFPIPEENLKAHLQHLTSHISGVSDVYDLK